MSKYTVETKLKAIELYKKGLGSRQIQCKLNIPSHSTIDRWIILFKKYGKAGLITKRTRKKYSGQFKLEVLNWRKEHNESYQATVLKYGISNTGIIANWQRAYEEGGIDALFIKQGRPTMHKKAKHKKINKSELSELERLRLENRALHVEVEYLKKLDALVQKRGHLKKKDESSQN